MADLLLLSATVDAALLIIDAAISSLCLAKNQKGSAGGIRC